MSKNKRLIGAGFIIAIVVGIVVVFLFCLDPEPRENKYVGWSEKKVVNEFGEPESIWDGHFGSPPITFKERYPEAKTLVFKVEGGKLYVSFEPRGKTWICFTSSYLPDGSEF